MKILLKDLQPSTLYYVQLRSKEEARVSAWSRLFPLETVNETMPPMPVTNLSGAMSQGNLALVWTPPTQNEDGTELEDLKDYVVTIGPIPADSNWPLYTFYVEGSRAEFTKEMNVAAFGTYRAALNVEVRARDILDNVSEPASITVTKPRPLPPTNLTWTAVKNSFSGSWDSPTNNVGGSPFDDPNGFDISIIYDTTNIRKYSAATTRFDFSYEQNKATFGGVQGTAKTPLTIEVRARDSVGQLSDPATATAGNEPPSKPTGVVATQVSEGIRVVWNGNPEDDIVAYEIWSAGSLAGAGTLYGRVSSADREYIHQTVAYGQDHYLYVTAVDDFGSRSVESDRSGPVRPRSPFGVDTTPPGTTTLTASTAIRSSSTPAAVDLSWPAVVDDDLAGYHIRYSRAETAARSWEYYDVIDKTATSVTIEGLFSDTPYAFQIRSYDTVINTSEWSLPESTANSSESTSPPMTDISSDISVISGGALRSANYDETAQTGWRLMHSGLDILSGSVNARVIKAGTMFSTQNVTHDGTTQPAWSLNLAGNMSINDAQVRGKIVVGNSGAANGEVNIASFNYGGTGNQWAIKGDGTIDLKGGTVTGGAAGANSLQITNTGITGKDGNGNPRFVLTSSGTFSLATTNGGVVFDDNGIYGYSGATNTFRITRTGDAYFQGQISAGSGVIANWSINPNSLTGGGLTLDSSAGQITSGSGTSRVGMRASWGFWAGADNHWNSPPFRVDTNGALYSSSGVIGGWTIGPNSLSGSGQIIGGSISSVTMDASTINASTFNSQYLSMGASSPRTSGITWVNAGAERASIDITRTFVGGALSWTYRLDITATDGVRFTSSIISTHSANFQGVHDQGWRVYSPVNTPPYPVTSVNGMTGAVDGLAPAHSHPYASSSHSHSGESWSSLTLTTGLYGSGGYLLASSTGSPAIFFAGGDLRLATNSTTVTVRNMANSLWRPIAASAFNTNSSAKNKKGIIQAPSSIDKLMKLRPVMYNRSDDEESTPRRRGFIAEEVAEVMPDVVVDVPITSGIGENEVEETSPGLDMMALLSATIQGLQETNARLAALEARGR